MDRGELGLALISILAGMVLGLFIGWYVVGHTEPEPTAAKTVTVEKTVDRPVPGPETTVEKTVPGKRKPGTTTWIVVCGEQTQRVVNNKPTTECNLPDTGGERRHKAH